MLNKGIWITSGYRRGDLLIMDFDGKGIDHIGYCTGVNPDGSLETIEGNTGSTNQSNGGMVMLRDRPLKYIVGACRPSYPSESAIDKIISILEKQIGVKENPFGSNKVKYNTWFYGREVSGENYKWCVTLQAWAFNEAGMFELFMGGRKAASCTALAEYYGYKKITTLGSVGKVNISLDELKKGNSGAQAATLQRLLNALGHNCGEVDGEFGPKTETAVKAFQRAEKLSADGIVGARTWEALLK